MYSPYVYTADNGTNFQVMVPADFATALSQTPGTVQPFLPGEISPRYANYTGSDGSFRQAVIDTVAHFATVLGSTVVVGGVTYTCTSANAQQVPFLQQQPVNGAFLIQGPPGANGVFTPEYHFDSRSNRQAFGSGHGPYNTGPSFTITHAGDYLLFAGCVIENNNGSGQSALFELFIENGNTGASLGSGQLTIADGEASSIIALGIQTLPAGLPVECSVRNSLTTGWATDGTTTGAGYAPADYLGAIKLN